MDYCRSVKKTKFYNSKEWRSLARSFAKSKAWQCENCKNKRVDYSKPIYKQIIAHHKIHLTDENIDDLDISLNEDNLQLLCIKCHNEVHGNAVIADGLMFDKDGNIVELGG